jgi:hypothetical protein
MKPTSARSRIELYTQEPMVNWLGPLQLLRTALRTAIATTMGAFADPREVQAALKPAEHNPPIEIGADSDGGVWIDYLADTGDGWDSTYSIAMCVSQPARLVGQAELPPGRVLLLGGDQVYPTPAQGGYRTHFLDPFRAAFPAPVLEGARGNPEQSVPVKDAPLIVATPGNHDWYDGLRGFSELFCNCKPVGAWRTQQRTSYYALKVAQGWWIWGLDLQLESAVDRPQRSYFEQMLLKLGPGDRVVVCTPEPSWVEEAERVERENRKALPSLEIRTPRFRSLSEIEELLGPRLALVLAGDSHHYARYAPAPGEAGPQRITCGGGGAFLHGTHQLPDPPRPITVAGKRQQYCLATAYPDKKTSRRLRNRAVLLPTRNLSFCCVLAALYLLFVWVAESASKGRPSAPGDASLMARLSTIELSWDHIGEALHDLLIVSIHSPSTVVLALAIVAGCGALSRAGINRGGRLAFLAGAVHGALHVLLALGLLWFMGRVNIAWLGMKVDDVQQVTLFILGMLLLGGVLGGLLFGLWMVLTNTAWGLHGQEVFSSQRIDDYKCFLRMRFESGGLTIYPLKLERVCRHWSLGKGVQALAHVKRTWRLRATDQARGPRFVPAAGEEAPADRLQLIEQPIFIQHGGSGNEYTRL